MRCQALITVIQHAFKTIQHVAWAKGDLVIRDAGGGDHVNKAPFIVTLVLGDNRVGLQLFSADFSHSRRDSGGIKAATEENANLDVAPQAEANTVEKQGAKLFHDVF